MPRGRPVKCIHCGSTETASKGSRTTKTMGIRKIRRCKSCGRRFTPKNQKLIRPKSLEMTQAETSEPVEFDRAEPIHIETPARIEPEEPSDEHQTIGP